MQEPVAGAACPVAPVALAAAVAVGAALQVAAVVQVAAADTRVGPTAVGVEAAPALVAAVARIAPAGVGQAPSGVVGARMTLRGQNSVPLALAPMPKPLPQTDNSPDSPRWNGAYRKCTVPTVFVALRSVCRLYPVAANAMGAHEMRHHFTTRSSSSTDVRPSRALFQPS